VVEHGVGVVGDGFGVDAGLRGGVGVLEQVARGQADDVLVGIDDVLVAEFPEPCHAGGRGGFDADALLGQVALGRRYLIVADGDGGAARLADAGQRLGALTGLPMRMAVAMVSTSSQRRTSSLPSWIASTIGAEPSA